MSRHKRTHWHTPWKAQELNQQSVQAASTASASIGPVHSSGPSLSAKNAMASDTGTHKPATPMHARKPQKKRWLFRATQLPTQGQWWSNRSKHRLQIMQWLARGGFHSSHVSHHLNSHWLPSLAVNSCAKPLVRCSSGGTSSKSRPAAKAAFAVTVPGSV